MKKWIEFYRDLKEKKISIKEIINFEFISQNHVSNKEADKRYQFKWSHLHTKTEVSDEQSKDNTIDFKDNSYRIFVSDIYSNLFKNDF
jgi:hypothetical protein